MTVTSSDGSGPSLTIIASVLKTLTQYLPAHRMSPAAWSHLNGLTFADSDLFSSDPIDLLIGADSFGDLLLEGMRKGEVGQPIALNTIFGWILTGPSSSSDNASRVTVHHCAVTEPLDQELRRFWEAEEVPSQPILSHDDQRCEDHFVTTHSRQQDGRYMVRLPFKSGPPINIGTSRLRAEHNLRCLHRRFKTHPELREAYVQCLQEYIELGHMTATSASDLGAAQAVYIPHLPVVREDSSTTRLRVVFNASSRSSNATSLNDHLLAGPKLQSDLSAVILRWRMHRYVMSADISKMYRQILIDSRDRFYQCILWSPDAEEPPTIYSLATVTFGTSSAPFIALRVLRQLMHDEGRSFPWAVAVLRDNTYVDDLLFGADDLPRLIQTRDQLRSLLLRGHFELRKWTSNSPVPLQDICSTDHALSGEKILQSDHYCKILGISWDPKLDSFLFHVKHPVSGPPTKRTILSTIAKIFDPLGWGTPVTIAAKIFMQKLWLAGLNWDESLPPSLSAQWAAINQSLAELDGIQIERWYGRRAASDSCELHGFSDASCSAYSAVVYLRVVSGDGSVHVSLLLGKSKVAPVQTWSIPRLELAGAALLSRLMEFSLTTLYLPDACCHCWSDSTVVLAWLAQQPARWNTFVANRVAAIQQRLPSVSWRHVPSQDNPADCASRGIRGLDLAGHSLWWKGPLWLRLEPHDWPGSITIPATQLEEKTGATTLLMTTSAQWDLADRFSSWTKLLRVTAYVMRFIKALKGRLHDQPRASPVTEALSSSEVQQARAFWVRYIQSEVFPRELTALRSSKPLPVGSALRALHPFIDDAGIIRVGGRLRHATMASSQKHPILLADHQVVTLLVRHTHLQRLHAGPQLTLAVLRQEFWILRARTLVRAIVHRCIVCVRERAAVPIQLMGDLPDVRVTPPARAFQHCGVDYAGPVPVRSLSGRGHPSRKAYIAIFICMASKAVHLELVDGYSTPAFLAALARFCARRGLPSSIYSDNGTTFKGADRELKRAFHSAVKDPTVQNHLATDGVAWKYIPPSAPHFGGLWEAGVRSIKHHVKRVVGSHTLTFEEFSTLLCNVESCLNSRPLAPLSDSPDDLDPLTPGHFLIGSSLAAIPEPSVLSLNEHRLARWQLVRLMTERFWRQWTTDYLHTLQQRGKWRTISSSPVRIGQLVLLRNPGLPPSKWELGRVIQIHAGADGLVRVVSVRTSHSVFMRPISKLCPLPVDCCSSDASSTSTTPTWSH